MRKVLAAISISLLMVTVCLSGCIGEDDDDRLLVLTTIVPLGEVIEEVGGEHVDVRVMVPWRGDILPVQLASQALFGRLLRAAYLRQMFLYLLYGTEDFFGCVLLQGKIQECRKGLHGFR